MQITTLTNSSFFLLHFCMFIHIHVCACTPYTPTSVTLCVLNATQRRYKILCAKKVTDGMDPKKAAEIILGEVAMTDQYRLGASKVLVTTPEMKIMSAFNVKLTLLPVISCVLCWPCICVNFWKLFVKSLWTLESYYLCVKNSKPQLFNMLRTEEKRRNDSSIFAVIWLERELTNEKSYTTA